MSRWSRLLSAASRNCDGYDLVCWAKNLWLQYLSEDVIPVYIPLFSTYGRFVVPEGEGLPIFFHVLVEAIVDEDLSSSDRSRLIFLGKEREFEVCDSWGGVWYLIIRSLSDDGDAERSHCSTPLRRNSGEMMSAAGLVDTSL